MTASTTKHDYISPCGGRALLLSSRSYYALETANFLLRAFPAGAGAFNGGAR